MGTSTPRSPRATMMPSDSRMISLKLSSASGISILAMTFNLLLLSCNIFLMPMMSSTFLTKESATQSRFSLMMKSRSIKSFSVSAGREIFVSGKFNPFFDEMIPPSFTLTFTSPLGMTSCTTTSILPSSIMMVFPSTTSPARFG